jgi:glycosyltransferase involved in cell wall biosynthesis
MFYTRQPYFLIALTIFKKPIIYEIHQWHFYKSRVKDRFFKYFILKAVNRNNCKIFICISEELRKRWIKLGIKSDKTITAHDAVNINDFKPLIAKEDARVSLNLSANAQIVSYVGSLYKNRAILDIMWVASKLPNVLFRIIGGPAQNKEAFKEIVNKNGLKNVELTGRIQRNQVPLYLFSSDVLLFTMNENTITHDICSPMKVFEYLAAARVIVAPDLPSMREILTPDYSFLYEFPDKYSLRDKIIEALKLVSLDSNYERQKKGRIVVQEKFTWEKRTKLILTKLMKIRK